MSLGLVIPLLDEVDLTADVATAIHQILARANIDHTLVLVDNGCTDGTGEVIDSLAQSLPVKPVHLAKNAGYGGGILAGLAVLEADPPEVIGWCWGDGQVRPDALPPLYRACLRGAPMAKVIRTERLDGAARRVVSASYAAVIRSLGVDHPDINGCPKLFRREALDALRPTSTDWFLDAEVVLGALAQGMEIATHPTVMQPRAAGRSKVGTATIFEFAWNLAKWRATHHL